MVLAFSIFPRIATAQETTAYFYHDTLLTGIMAASISVPFVDCKKFCEARAGCAGFDHVAQTNQCRLFSVVQGAIFAKDAIAQSRSKAPNYGPESAMVPIPALAQPAPVVVSTPPAAITPSTVDKPAFSPAAPVKQAVAKPNSTSSSWRHKESIVSLIEQTDGKGATTIDIYYDKPRYDLLPIGIHSGMKVFSGIARGGRLVGKARLMNSRCGYIEYDVEGPFTPGDNIPFTLKGKSPNRGGDCKVHDWSDTGNNAVLRFDPAT